MVAGASTANVRAAACAAGYGQPGAAARPGNSAAAPSWSPRTADAASQAAGSSSDQPAARSSRTGGQPRHHAAAYPASATRVSGHVASIATSSSSHPAALTALRSSHRPAASFSHDHRVIATAPGRGRRRAVP